MLILFYADNTHLGHWKTMPEKERKEKYSPAAVRKLIQKANKPLGIDEMNYKALCSFGVHVTPESLRTPHHHDGKGYIGPAFSVTGFALLLNEIQ